MAVWQIGMDEAGYGPILGPFVMTAVAFSSHRPIQADDPWKLLRCARDELGRKRRSRNDGNDDFCVADSKRIHRGKNGLAHLEYHTLPVLWPWLDRGQRFGTLLKHLTVRSIEGLHRGCYQAMRLKLPLCHQPDAIERRAAIWQGRLSAVGLTMHRPRVYVLLPESINQAIARHATKAMVCLDGLSQLLGAVLRDSQAFRVPASASLDRHGKATAQWEVVCDRLGGRTHYAAVLTAALEDWHLQAYRETAARCEYLFTPRDAGLVPGEPPPRLRLVITPQAESQSFAVALASMVSKYIREIFMHHWNAYWQQQVPGLRPTAGYPGDALRFLQAIEQARLQLGLEEAVLRRYR